MISKELAFHAPKTLNDALSLLDRHGDDAKILSGGMSLVPVMTLGLLQPEVVISLNHVSGLDYIREDGNLLRIGGMVRHAKVLSDPLVKKHCPVLAEAAAFVGDVQVRHRGTIGGSLAHADPAADYVPVSMVVGAQVRLQSSKGERVVKAVDFFKDLMQTALQPGEILTEVQVPKLAAGTGSAYCRLHRVEGNFAIVAAAAVIEAGFKAARVGIAGVGPKAVVIEVSKRLAKGVNDEALRGISDDAYAASAEAYGDLNGDATYRRAMARVYAQRAVQAAAGRMK